MTQLEIFQRTVAKYKVAADDSERQQLLAEAIAEYHSVPATEEEKQTTKDIIADVLSSMIANGLRNLDRRYVEGSISEERLEEVLAQLAVPNAFLSSTMNGGAK